MSTTIELQSGELVTLAAGRDGHTQLQIYGRNVSPPSPATSYRAVDAVVQLRPEEVARLVTELVTRLPARSCARCSAGSPCVWSELTKGNRPP